MKANSILSLIAVLAIAAASPFALYLAVKPEQMTIRHLDVPISWFAIGLLCGAFISLAQRKRQNADHYMKGLWMGVSIFRYDHKAAEARGFAQGYSAALGIRTAADETDPEQRTKAL